VIATRPLLSNGSCLQSHYLATAVVLRISWSLPSIGSTVASGEDDRVMDSKVLYPVWRKILSVTRRSYRLEDIRFIFGTE
jgi:hypothetical protein